MAAYVKRAASIFGAEVTPVHVCDLGSHNGFKLYARTADDIAEEHWNVRFRNRRRLPEPSAFVKDLVWRYVWQYHA